MTTYQASSFRAEIVNLPDGRCAAYRPVVDDIDLDDMIDCPVIPAGQSVDGVLARHALGLAETVPVPAGFLLRVYIAGVQL